MYYVYILQNKKTKNHYIGCSADLKERLDSHNAGKVQSTKAYKPWEIVYYEAHRTKSLALKAETHYKSSQGRRQIKKKLGLE